MFKIWKTFNIKRNTALSFQTEQAKITYIRNEEEFFFKKRTKINDLFFCQSTFLTISKVRNHQDP